MTTSYLRRGMTGTATFSLFVRSLPSARGFLVAAGVESCLDRLQDFRFEEDDIRYLKDTQGFEDRDLEAFRRLRFTGDVWAIPEGRVVLAGEPILEVTGPLPEAQLVETLLLNQVTFETTIASRASRPASMSRGFHRWSALWPPATSKRPGATAWARRARWPIPTSKRLPAKSRPSVLSRRTFPAARRSSSTPTTPSQGSSARLRSSRSS